MTRLNKILIGALVVQLAVAAFVLTRGDRTRLAAQRPVVPGFAAAAVTKVAVYDKDVDQPAVVLQRVGDGWQLASQFGHPADPTKVDGLLTKIAGLRTRGPIATSPVRFDQLRVGDRAFERKVVLTSAAGDTTLYLGDAREGRTNAVRVGGGGGAHAVTTLSAWSVDIDGARWIDQVYFRLDRDRVARVVVQRPTAAVELDRGATGWQLTAAGMPVPLAPGETLDTAAVERLIGNLAEITLTGPGDPARDITAPAATISVWVSPADPAGAAASPEQRVADHTLDVIADGDNYWIRERGRPTAGVVTRGGLSAVVEADRGSLVKKVSAGTAAPAARPGAAPKLPPPPRPPG